MLSYILLFSLVTYNSSSQGCFIIVEEKTGECKGSRKRLVAGCYMVGILEVKKNSEKIRIRMPDMSCE
jgi:hypothetical protein